MKVSLVISLLLSLSFLDILTTLIGIKEGLIEENFFLSQFENNIYVFFTLMTALKVSVIVAVYYLLKRKAYFPAYALAGLYLFVDLHNLLLIH
ncbi:DUF5658 family protein [Acidianus sp. HS-5]|uniref:DUF5658 family protein n=1 Tax=Acidianus sp. HS-5 TaxID=2886040 RepID=UPI001F384FC8|nr:DUF5658 family protein [Acidianus sp. HS-5]BDC17295.1 hypothetical protein HS5_01850 [Acidianus sp. HS-5]